jgi:general secretion pathway protein A
MYKAFYRLERNPFEITPDPSFLFPTTRHNEALATLYYGVTAHRGFVVLTGEVGTGKTLLLRSLLGLLQRRDIAFALIINPSYSPLEFIRCIAGDFGLPIQGKAKDELVRTLNEFLLQRYQRGLTTLLAVDEAHLLSAEVLEEIRLLTNLETSQQKLLQIVLAGQPELDQKLDSYELRQLKQRVALRCRLDCLNREETSEYIQRRLRIAGANGGEPIFDQEAIAAVHQHSKGIPRLINTICENALLAGYAKQEEKLTAEVIRTVASDLRLGVTTEKSNGGVQHAAGSGPEGDDLLRAVKMLLEVRNRMQQGADVKEQLQ